MSLPQRDQAHHTYADYRTWSEDTRYELIDGIAYLMAPAPDLAHQEVVGEVFFQLRRALEGTPCRVFIAPVDVRLPKAHEEDGQVDTVVQPDVLVVCDPSKLDRRGVRGAPDLVVEVLSPATSGHDQGLKRTIYEQAGVREYWLIHPIDRLVTRYLLEDGTYGKPAISDLAGEMPIAILPGITIVWDALVQRLPPVDS